MSPSGPISLAPVCAPSIGDFRTKEQRATNKQQQLILSHRWSDIFASSDANNRSSMLAFVYRYQSDSRSTAVLSGTYNGSLKRHFISYRALEACRSPVPCPVPPRSVVWGPFV